MGWLMKNYSNILLIAHNKLWFMLLNEWNFFDCYLRNWCVVIKKGVCFHSCLTMLVYSLHPSVQMIWEVFSGMVQLKTSLVSRMICQGWHFRDLEGFKECESSPSIQNVLDDDPWFGTLRKQCNLVHKEEVVHLGIKFHVF